MAPLNEHDLKFIEAAKQARERPFNWWLFPLPIICFLTFLLVGIGYVLCYHFSTRGLEFVICTFYRGKYEPTEVQLRQLFGGGLLLYLSLCSFTFIFSYIAWKTQRRAFEIIQKVAGNIPPQPLIRE